jgi:signal transduction histidine kinase
VTTRVRIGALAPLALFVVMALGGLALQLSLRGLDPFVLALVLFAAYPAMGALILLRRGSNRIGWILEAIGILLLVMTVSGDYAGYALQVHPGSLPFGKVAIVLDQTIWSVGLFLFGFVLPLTFPTGHLMSKRWLIPIGFALLYFALVIPSNALYPGYPLPDYPKLANPIGWPGHNELLANIQTLSLIPVAIAIVGTIASVVVRFRRSFGVERQQLKWFMFSVLLIPVTLALNGVPILDKLSFVIAVPALAISIGLAVLRYGLYDIDVVISRTLVYGALAAFITAVYIGIVVGIGHLVGSGGQPNLVLSIVATAIVAVAFQPVRERLQRVANRLIYGNRATPYEVLAQFSERVAETYAADEALPRMARVLAEGTGAEHATVWLRSGQQMHAAAVWPQATSANGAGAGALPVAGQVLPAIEGATRTVAVRHQGELLGALSLTKRPGESLTPIEGKLLDDLAHQAGLVLKNVGLTAELLARLEDLRASRQRLVAAQDEERRRLERNLHDGAQQNLVALKVKLSLAEAFAEKDPAKAKELVGQLKADADEALDTLRDLARGIYPPLLADKGLVAALESQAHKATLPVSVEAGDVGRYPQEIEAAVYFCVLEALQNVQKYAGASTATVNLTEEAGELRFQVVDDGNGFDSVIVKKGSGLTNMEDRFQALGGSIQISSTAGRGTTVTGAVVASGLVVA